MAFFQACWDVLKVDIMNVFHDFHTRGLFEKSFNAIFITLILIEMTLILKKPGVVDIKDF